MCVVVNMNVIKRKRKELGISQRELSEKLGTSQQTISRIEKSEVENIPSSLLVSAKYCYAAHESRLHQNDRCKRFTLV